jgi:hypothetical protein
MEKVVTLLGQANMLWTERLTTLRATRFDIFRPLRYAVHVIVLPPSTGKTVLRPSLLLDPQMGNPIDHPCMAGYREGDPLRDLYILKLGLAASVSVPHVLGPKAQFKAPILPVPLPDMPECWSDLCAVCSQTLEGQERQTTSILTCRRFGRTLFYFACGPGGFEFTAYLSVKLYKSTSVHKALKSGDRVASYSHITEQWFYSPYL